MRILTAITGIILIATSVWSIAHAGATFISMAFIIGAVMIIHGAGGICAYIGSRNEIAKSSWILAEAVSTAILGIIVLANMLTVDAVIPVFFGMWAMYSGMLRTIASTHMIIAKEKGWIWVLLFGAVTIIIGIYSFFNVIALSLDNIVLIGIIFIAQGANLMALAVNMPGKYKIIPHDFLHHHQAEKPEADFTFKEEEKEEQEF